MNPTPPLSDSFLRIDASAAADGRGLAAGPVSILLRIRDPLESGGLPTGRAVVRAIGSPEAVRLHPDNRRARVVSRPGCLLIPGLVNAHTHLDLTHIGPRPRGTGAGFGEFVDLVRRERAFTDAEIAASVRHGIEQCLRGATVAVGDIAGAPRGMPSLIPYKVLLDSRLGGVSFVEFFAIGTGSDGGLRRFMDVLGEGRSLGERCGHRLTMRLGRQPHAPTTVSLASYHLMYCMQPGRVDMPTATHLAETPEEHEFIATGSGPHADLLRSLGLWNDSVLESQPVCDGELVDGVGRGKTPVQHLAPVLGMRPYLCAHVNDASDDDIQVLARTGAMVAYCPRASNYFGAHEHFGPHRYREMLAAGINVCLGTDSIINLPEKTARLSILDEMRFLYRRDGTLPLTLLQMGTTNGAEALGLDAGAFSLAAGTHLAGLVAVPFEPIGGLSPLAAALSCDSAPELLLIGK